MKSPIILALDTQDVAVAQRWIRATHSEINTYKVGLEFFLRNGASGIRELREYGDFDLFLDLKLHDIPNTVGAAAASVADIKPRFLTVHASGGSAMIASAVKSLPSVDITAVTILTSLGDDDVLSLGFKNPALESAVGLARMAANSGAKAIVCSPLEVKAIRTEVGSQPILITPGVRPAGSALGDQLRVMTPKEAISAGSTYLVIGRPITSLSSEREQLIEAKRINDSIFE